MTLTKIYTSYALATSLLAALCSLPRLANPERPILRRRTDEHLTFRALSTHYMILFSRQRLIMKLHFVFKVQRETHAPRQYCSLHTPLAE
jgi:hypothetical protein